MIASWLAKRSYRRFIQACRSPRDAQAACLRRVLRGAADSEFGRAHNFLALARIRDAADVIAAYQAAVPLRRFDEMRADLDAVYQGEWRRLCPSRPIFFSMTAGSTGHFKYIPVTRELRRDLGRGSTIYCGALEASYPVLRKRSMQFLVGSAEGGLSPAGVPQGFASGFNYKNLPALLRRRFVLPYWIFTLEQVDDRNYAAGRILLDHPNIGALCAISPVNLINICESLEANAERLFADVAAGTLTLCGTGAVPGEYRARANPGLAAALQTGWRRDARLPRQLLFPSLDVLVCWQGGNMSYYLNDLDHTYGVARHFEFPLSASEGFFAVPHRANTAGGIIAVTTHFLEFIPEEDSAPSDRALRADQLQVGGEYRMVVTTSGGLYRYDMEDVVRVTGFMHHTPVITFISKTHRQVSVANERVTERDVTMAMQAASTATGLWVKEFLFVPCTDRRYRVLLDGTALQAVPPGDREAVAHRFSSELEQQFRRSAAGYDFERDDALLAPLQLAVTRPGELREYLHGSLVQHAIPNAQVKPLHLTPEFDAHRHFSGVQIYAA